MFIRQTTTRRKKDGSNYTTHRLVESIRVGEKVRQQTLLHLATDFSIARAQWPALTTRVQEILHHQESLLSVDETVEAEAQRIAASLIEKKQEYAPAKTPEPGADYRTVDVDSVQSSQLRSVGVEHLAVAAVRSLELDTQLATLGLNPAEVTAAIGLIVGRMAAPGSERATHRWLQRESGLGELLGTSFHECSLSRLYRVSDRLLAHREALERLLFERERSLFGLDCTITLYDLTNTFFEGSGKHNGHAAFGRSKEKRSDCPLVTLGLVLDGSGFPRRSQIFAGNVSEPVTLQEMVETLADGVTKPLIVMDAGLATKANLAWLEARGCSYLTVHRHPAEAWEAERAELVRQHGTNEVRIYKKRNEATGEAELYCHSTRRAEKEAAMDTQFTQRFEAKLTALQVGLSKKGCIKRYERVLERIGRLKEKYARVACEYDIQVEKAATGPNATALTFVRTRHRAKDYAGVYCLRTNLLDWDAEKLWHTYIMLTDLEAVFRSMKSELGMRPVYHQTTERVEGHLWITLLAYHLVHVLRVRLQEQGIHDSWESLRRRMRGHMRVTTSLRTQEGTTLHIRKAARPEAWQQTIYTALGIASNPGGTRKTVLET